MEFRSHVVRLLLHREASQIIADIYELHANAMERAILLRDFYGREAALFPLPHKGEDTTKDERVGLPAVLQGASEEQRRRILASLRENLDLMLVYSLFYLSCLLPRIAGLTTPTRALSDTQLFIGHSGSTCLNYHRSLIIESARSCIMRYLRGCITLSFISRHYSLVCSCKDLLAEMVHTRDGSRVVREFLARGTAKVCCLFPPFMCKLIVSTRIVSILSKFSNPTSRQWPRTKMLNIFSSPLSIPLSMSYCVVATSFSS